MSESYRALEARFARMSHVGGALAMLQWDQQVMMPPGGNGVRGEQMATLRQMAHELLTSAETGELLDRAEQDAAALGPWQAANLREMRRSQRRATAMPSDLVASLTRAASAAEMIWREARARADFAMLRPAQHLYSRRGLGWSLERVRAGWCGLVDSLSGELRESP